MDKVISGCAFHKYLDVDNAKLFTIVCVPQDGGKFPTVVCRSPYVDITEQQTAEEVCADKLRDFKDWLDHGYAVVFQHCRGRGRLRLAG